MHTSTVKNIQGLEGGTYVSIGQCCITISISSLLNKTLVHFQLLELVFKVFPEEGPQVFSQLLPQLFQSVVDEEVSNLYLSKYLALSQSNIYINGGNQNKTKSLK